MSDLISVAFLAYLNVVIQSADFSVFRFSFTFFVLVFDRFLLFFSFKFQFSLTNKLTFVFSLTKITLCCCKAEEEYQAEKVRLLHEQRAAVSSVYEKKKTENEQSRKM